MINYFEKKKGGEGSVDGLCQYRIFISALVRKDNENYKQSEGSKILRQDWIPKPPEHISFA